MDTGLAANIEIFSDGETIFTHNANFEECAPTAAAEEIVTKLYTDEIMAKIDELQEQGAEVVYQLSLATSDGLIIVDGIAGDLIPEDTTDFSSDLYTGLSDLHKQMVEQQMMSEDCNYAAQPDVAQVASMKM